MAMQEMIAKQDQQRFDAMLDQGAQQVVRETLMLQAADGMQTPALFSLSPLPQSEGRVISVLIADLSEVVAAAAARSRLALIIDSSDDAIVSTTLEGVVESWNRAAEQLFGYSADEAIGQLLQTLIAPPEYADEVSGKFDAIRRGEHMGRLECMHRRKDGSLVNVAVTYSPILDPAGGVVGASINTRDITARKQAEESLQISLARFGTIFHQAPLGIALIDSCTGEIYEVNAQFARIAGRTVEEMATINWMSITHPDDVQDDLNNMALLNAGEISEFNMDKRYMHPDGSFVWINMTVVSLKGQKNSSPQHLCMIADITKRKQDEEALRRANRALKTLSAGNLTLVRSTSEEALLKDVTSVIVENGGYLLVTVCYAGDDAQKRITPMAWAGPENSYYLSEEISWDDTEQGQLPIARAIRSGTTQLCRDIANEAGYAPWKEAALAHGYASNLTMPLIANGNTFGGLSIYSSETDAFDEEEVHLLEELANDLAYGIITLRTRVEHEQHALILRQSLEQSIQMIAATVEARDPYTAGHQRRVADLATAIAREMVLPEEQVNGIHLAATIHDLGKIRVPAEILSKPGKLSTIEYQLIQVHSQEGYEILKEVTFPWPIATIILQHHEKLDGSGYPQGLKGEQILLEAKILTVADVVEAMSSDRPYRAGLGIEAALAEIKARRGVQFDPLVVDACLKLFRERGYTIPA
jgi:PAS domain S-box-containing protein